MTSIPDDVRLPRIVEQPEHCHKCYHLIHPGATYYQTAEDAVLCEECAGRAVEPHDTIQLSDELTVEATRTT